jgi:DNA-binding winged helix-turn-helix (wHTH) protein
MLIENSGKALTKEEIMMVIWRDAFVEETNLVKQNSRLRKILNNQKYFRKLSRKRSFSGQLRL